MSHRLSLTSILATGILLPTTAHAHGEQILLLPTGQLIAIVTVGFFALRKIFPGRIALIAFLAALASAALIWFVPFKQWGYTDTGIFLLGLLPPVVAATLVTVVSRRFRRTPGGA